MTRRVRFHGWSDPVAFAHGLHDGTTIRDGLLALGSSRGRVTYADPHRGGRPAEYDRATWTSPEVSPGFPFTELVASWNARTPAGTWLEVAVQATTSHGTTPWYVMGRWAETDRDIAPTSLPGQSDEHAAVDVDRVRFPAASPGSTYRVRTTLLRQSGSTATPAVSLLGCVASDVRYDQTRAPDQTPTRPGPAIGTVLDVPLYSQRLHLGEYPEWAGGGESWCSPTATSMVLARWGLGPSADDYAWVEAGLPDRHVPYAVRHTFDHAYRAPGNWSFNAAYAGRFGAEAFVTRLRSLAEAELFVSAGIPLVVGIAFTREQLEGARYDTAGHLVVLVGFDEAGDVVCNDPASGGLPSNAAVRATFDREEFECAWMRAAGGVTYVIRPPGVPLPQRPDEANW